MVSQFIEEIRLHSSLDHPTIVKFYALLEKKDSFYLVIEYLNGGTLFDYQNEVGALGVKQAVDFLKDIIDALIYLHEKSIAHRDLKPENIVICNGIAKVCDFGWSAVIQNVRSTFCGTLDYAPPEIIERKTYDTTVDLWCIGVLTY
jgi:serine/threonine protein kinase